MKRTEIPIVISTRDYDRVNALAMVAQNRDPAVSEFLLDELERASLIEPSEIAPDVVTMNAHVDFVNDAGRHHSVTLVYPKEENISEGRISVMTPIGAALLGLSVGQSIGWTTRNGREHRLTVLNVAAAPDGNDTRS